MKKLLLIILLPLIVYGFSEAKITKVDTLFVEDFESGSSHWTFTGNWAITDEDSNSPAHSLTESPSVNYLPDENTTATLIDTMNFSVYYDANISFWIKYDIENAFDFMYLEATKDNGKTWSNVKTWTGEDGSWFKEYISLGLYVGEPEVNLRFRWQSDVGIEESGTYFDDIIITSTKNIPPYYPLITYDNPPEFYEGTIGEFTDILNVYSIYGVADVEVSYKVDGSNQTKIIATKLADDEWEFIIPAQVSGSLIEYTLFAMDSIFNQTFHNETYKYISGDHKIYDSGISSFYQTTSDGNAKAVKVDPIAMNEYLSCILIRNYADADHISDDMTIHIWQDDGTGFPGEDLIAPFNVTPTSNTLEDNSAMTVVDLRAYSISPVGDFWIGFSSDIGSVYSTMEIPALDGVPIFLRSYVGSYNSSNWDWIMNSSYNFQYRAVIGTFNGIENNYIPNSKLLEQNYPNPFNPNTTINFSVAHDNSQIKLVVYNVKGQIVNTLVDGMKNAGKYAVNFDASTFNSGVYYYSLEVNGVKEATKRMVMIK